LTDVHAEHEIEQVASVVDVLQTPAFLCRQTDFIRACAQSGKPVNIKKGQFLAPHDMKNDIDKARHAARVVGPPGGRGTSSGGKWYVMTVLARAAVACSRAGDSAGAPPYSRWRNSSRPCPR